MAGSYTAEDYFSLVPEGTHKWELIKGFFEMSPSPLTEHQRISHDISRIMGNYFFLSKCRVFSAPFDVQLGDNVVQPDIVVICDKTKLVDRGCKGTPDMIVEIISPSTRKLDEKSKKSLYEDFLVPELWYVYPESMIVYKYTLLDGKYNKGELFNVTGQAVSSNKFPELGVKLEEIFYDW